MAFDRFVILVTCAMCVGDFISTSTVWWMGNMYANHHPYTNIQYVAIMLALKYEHSAFTYGYFSCMKIPFYWNRLKSHSYLF